jgi:hypothetical protein
MRIAILGWGSLICDPGSLAYTGEWKENGPKLPIEFSRLSTKGDRKDCLTLVIDTQNGEINSTRFTISTKTDLQIARENLKDRERVTSIKSIGFVNLADKSSLCCSGRQIVDLITEWAVSQGFDGVIWTDLPSNFEKELKKPFTIPNATEHLKSLKNDTKKNAQSYIRNAPAEVDTPLRRELKRIGWLKE